MRISTVPGPAAVNCAPRVAMNAWRPKLSRTFCSIACTGSPEDIIGVVSGACKHTIQWALLPVATTAVGELGEQRVTADAGTCPAPDSVMRRNRWNKRGRIQSLAPRSEPPHIELLSARCTQQPLPE